MVTIAQVYLGNFTNEDFSSFPWQNLVTFYFVRLGLETWKGTFILLYARSLRGRGSQGPRVSDRVSDPGPEWPCMPKLVRGVGHWDYRTRRDGEVYRDSQTLPLPCGPSTRPVTPPVHEKYLWTSYLNSRLRSRGSISQNYVERCGSWIFEGHNGKIIDWMTSVGTCFLMRHEHDYFLHCARSYDINAVRLWLLIMRLTHGVGSTCLYRLGSGSGF